MCHKMKLIALGMLLLTMAVFSSNAQAVVISFEQSEGFPTPCNSFAGMAVPSGIVDNWTAPTGSSLLIDDGPGGCGYPDAPAPITGTQEAVIEGPANINSSVLMDLTDSANLSMVSFYWAWRGNGNSRCVSEGYGAQTAFLDVEYFNLSGVSLGVDTFCGGLNPDWTPKFTLATPSASIQGIPLSKVEFRGTAIGYPSWHGTFFLEDIKLEPPYPASTATPLATDLSMNQYRLKDVGDVVTKGPWVDARSYNGGAFNDVTINAAITAIGTDKKPLLLAPGTWTISANVTVPSNINIRFEQGAILSIGAGWTFTINGPIEAPIAQIYTGSGTVSFGGDYVKEAYPQWWGAKGDGTTDDTTAIQAAVNSGCKRIYFTRPSSTYAFTGLTIGASTSNLSLVGESYGNVELRYTPTTGNGITFAGEADNFTMKDIGLRAINNSSGTAIFSNNISSAPLRDTIFENLNISGFLKGVIIQGGMNGKIVGGRYAGQGKTVVGGIGIQLGEDANYAYTHGMIEHVYIEVYETGVYNKYCNTMHLEDVIIGTAVVALKIGAGRITYAEHLNFDSNNDTAIDNGGYLYYRSTSASLGTQTVTTTQHRMFKESYDLARVNVYRDGNDQTGIASDVATKVQFNGEREDTEGYFDPTTNSRFTANFSGYYLINAIVQWRAGVKNKQYKTMIYKNGTLLTEQIDYSRGPSGGFTPYYFSVPCSTMTWLDKNDYIEIYVQHNEGVNSQIGWGDGKTFLVVVSK